MGWDNIINFLFLGQLEHFQHSIKKFIFNEYMQFLVVKLVDNILTNDIKKL